MQYKLVLQGEGRTGMKTPVTVRIETQLLDEARRCASEENRTLTNFIETVLRRRVAETSSKAPVTPNTGVTRTARRIKDKTSHVA